MDSNTIMTVLKDEIIDYIKSSRSPYTSDVSEVLRGVHGPDDIVNRPFIGITIEKDILREEVCTGKSLWEVRVILYCYMEPSVLGNYDNMYQMKDDIKYFLKNDFSHSTNTTIMEFTPIEGGSQNSVNYFDLLFKIIYQED